MLWLGLCPLPRSEGMQRAEEADRSVPGSRVATENFQPPIRYDKTLSHLRQSFVGWLTARAPANATGSGTPNLRFIGGLNRANYLSVPLYFSGWCLGCATHSLPGHMPLVANIYELGRELVKQLVQG